MRALLDRIAALPGVRSAAVTTMLPMSGAGSTIHFNVKGRPVATPTVHARRLPGRQRQLLSDTRHSARERASAQRSRSSGCAARHRDQPDHGAPALRATKTHWASTSSSARRRIPIRNSPTWKSSASSATCASSRTPTRGPRCTFRYEQYPDEFLRRMVHEREPRRADDGAAGAAGVGRAQGRA